MMLSEYLDEQFFAYFLIIVAIVQKLLKSQTKCVSRYVAKTIQHLVVVYQSYFINCFDVKMKSTLTLLCWVRFEKFRSKFSTCDCFLTPMKLLLKTF